MMKFPKPEVVNRTLSYEELLEFYPDLKTVDDLPWEVWERKDVERDIAVNTVYPKHFYLNGVRWRGQSIHKKEPWTNKWLRSIISPYDVFYDVGANCGQYSLYAAALGCRQIFSFEPHLRNFYYMMENIKVNNFDDQITPIPFAISTDSTVTEWWVSEEGDGLSSANSKAHNPRFDKTYMYQTSIDALQALLPPPTIIKVDVDGTVDTKILQGALHTLHKTKHIMIEVIDWEKWYDFEEGLLGLGFKVNSEMTEAVKVARSESNRGGENILSEVFLERHE